MKMQMKGESVKIVKRGNRLPIQSEWHFSFQGPGDKNANICFSLEPMCVDKQ